MRIEETPHTNERCELPWPTFRCGSDGQWVASAPIATKCLPRLLRQQSFPGRKYLVGGEVWQGRRCGLVQARLSEISEFSINIMSL
jgi:hypothetical protein